MTGLGGKSLPLSIESLGLTARGVAGRSVLEVEGKGLAFQGAGIPVP